MTRVKTLYQPLNYRTKYSLGCFTLWILVLLLILKIPDASAARYAAVIVEEKTGKILHAVNPDLRTYPASLTKMMTLYLVFEKLKKEFVDTFWNDNKQNISFEKSALEVNPL